METEVVKDSLGRVRTANQRKTIARINNARRLPDGLQTKSLRIALSTDDMELFSSMDSQRRGEVFRAGLEKLNITT